MGLPVGLRRDAQALEQRRMLAARLLDKGYSQSEVARRVGAQRQSVSQWAAALKEKGRAGLKRADRMGPKPRLDARAVRKVNRGLKRGPEAFGYSTGRWTTARVAHLIEMECGVRYHPDHVWRILRQMGWRFQRPARTSVEHNEQKMRRWKQKRWSEIRQKPKRSRARWLSSTKAD